MKIKGATAFSITLCIMTSSFMTIRIMLLIATLRINDNQNNDNRHGHLMCTDIPHCHWADFSLSYCYAECHYATCCYAECHYADCCYAECRYAECPSDKCRYAECHCTKYHNSGCCGAEKRLTKLGPRLCWSGRHRWCPTRSCGEPQCGQTGGLGRRPVEPKNSVSISIVFSPL